MSSYAPYISSPVPQKEKRSDIRAEFRSSFITRTTEMLARLCGWFWCLLVQNLRIQHPTLVAYKVNQLVTWRRKRRRGETKLNEVTAHILPIRFSLDFLLKEPFNWFGKVQRSAVKRFMYNVVHRQDEYKSAPFATFCHISWYIRLRMHWKFKFAANSPHTSQYWISGSFECDTYGSENVGISLCAHRERNTVSIAICC